MPSPTSLDPARRPRRAAALAVRHRRRSCDGAIVDSFRKLDPRVQIRNPVMFVVFVGSIFTTVIGVGAAHGQIQSAGAPGFILAIAVWLWLTVLFANFAEAVAEGRGKAQAATLRSMRRHVHAKRLISNKRERVANRVEAADAAPRRSGARRGGRHHSRRRRDRRRCRVGERKRRDRRIGAGAARGRRRFLVRHRRHARAVRLDRRARDEPRRRRLPRSHDRDGRGREARQDAERDRAVDPARDDDARVPARDRDARAVLAVRGECRRAGLGRHADGARRAARVPDSDDDRRVAVGDRHRRHGSHGARQRDRDLRPRGRGGRRRRRAAARQDRHDHARRSAGVRVRAGTGRDRAGAGRCGAARVARR